MIKKNYAYKYTKESRYEKSRKSRKKEVNVLVYKVVDYILQGNLDKNMNTKVYLNNFCEDKNPDIVEDDPDL